VLLFCRRSLSFEEQKLGTQQPNAFRTGFEGRTHVVERADVCDDIDSPAVRGNGRYLGAALCGVGCGVKSAGALLVVVKDILRRVDVDEPRSSVEEQHGSVRHIEHALSNADDRGDAEGAGEDCAVRRGPAECRHYAARAIRVEAHRLRGG
jgi:hypothetical protein